MNQIPNELMKTAQEWCQNANAPMVFSGAGLSVESGISAFRTEDGLWNQVDVEKYATPQGFRNDPKAVRKWYWERRMALPHAKPNPGHLALAKASWRHATQNVDDLLERAGCDNVLHLHGTLLQERCHHNCGYEVDVDVAVGPPRNGVLSATVQLVRAWSGSPSHWMRKCFIKQNSGHCHAI